MDNDRRLLDYRVLAGRLATLAVLLGAGAFIGIIVQGLQQGLSFRLMGRWVAGYVLVYLLVAALVTAVHAINGARRAAAQGERIGSRDVGLLPRRPPGGDEQ